MYGIADQQKFTFDGIGNGVGIFIGGFAWCDYWFSNIIYVAALKSYYVEGHTRGIWKGGVGIISFYACSVAWLKISSLGLSGERAQILPWRVA